jgi:spore coat protein A
MISHPMHVHLMTFQVVERRQIDSSSMDFRTGTTRAPITIGDSLPILPEESGWKDTVNVTANTMVVVVGRLAPQTGRVVYHCHSLDHEDEGMMRPLVVMPRPVNTLHDMQMAMMQGDSSRHMEAGR